jgi:hypothetical protein
MQQTLNILAQAAATAEQKGLIQTQHQLLGLSKQLNFLALQNNPSPLFIEIMKKVAIGVQTKLNDNSQTLNDEVLTQECQAHTQALFNTRIYIKELETQVEKLQEMNTYSEKRQKFFDNKKNEALRLFNEQLRLLRAKAELNHADLLAFNEYVRAMLERDFAVNNLPKATQPQAQATNTQGFQAANVGKMFKGFSELMDATNGNDKEKMKSAGRTFVGSILGMIVEMIANVCTRFAPSIAPLIGNLAKLAKGAFSQWFDVSMEDSGLFTAQSQKTAQAEQAPVQQTAARVPPVAPTPGTAFSDTSGLGIQNFLSNSMPNVRNFLNAFRSRPAQAFPTTGVNPTASTTPRI